MYLLYQRRVQYGIAFFEGFVTESTKQCQNLPIDAYQNLITIIALCDLAKGHLVMTKLAGTFV